MKKDKIINIIKEKNASEVEFINNFAHLSAKLGLEPVNNRNNRVRLLFSGMSVAIGVVALLFLALFIFVPSNQKDDAFPNDPSDENNVDNDNVNENKVFKYFDDHNINYISNPIETRTINGEQMNIYIGRGTNDMIVLAFSSFSNILGTNITVQSTGVDNDQSIGEAIIVENDDFAMASFKVVHIDYDSKYIVLIDGEINESEKITIEINIDEYIDDLK